MAVRFAIIARFRQLVFAIFAILFFALIAKDAVMTDPQHDIRIWLQEQLAYAGYGAKGALARHLGVRADAVTRMVNIDPAKESREIAAHELAAIEQFFGARPPGLGVTSGPVMVRIRGKAGAGPDGTVLFAEGDTDFGEVEAPPYATPDTEGLEVEGHSMRDIAHDGSLIYYDDRRPPELDHMGNLCVCWLEDGRVMVKYPSAGSAPGLFNLESTSARTLRDVPVRYFAHVTGIIPRIQAQKLVRKHRSLTFTDQVIEK